MLKTLDVWCCSSCFLNYVSCQKVSWENLEMKSARISGRLFLAEAEGFEPPVPCGTPVFKTGAIDQLCQTSVRVQIYVIHFKMFRNLLFNQQDVELE